MGKMTEVLERGGRQVPGDDQPEGQRRPGTAQEPTSAEERRSAASLNQAPPETRRDYIRVGDGRSPDQERLVSLYAPGSPQAKRIDILRSQLLFPFHGEPPRIIMIASAAPREGRSLLASNLAVSFARGLQQYVMVMDCHLTDPVIHELLRVPRQPGLNDFLEQNVPVPEIIHRTPVDKLSVIPAGSTSQRSAEILATDKMAGLLAELRARYHDRYIILDTPPVQAFDDPQVLARLVEGIVFVVQAGVTDRDLALRCLRSLPEEKIVGVVMNDTMGAVVDAASLSGQIDTQE